MWPSWMKKKKEKKSRNLPLRNRFNFVPVSSLPSPPEYQQAYEQPSLNNYQSDGMNYGMAKQLNRAMQLDATRRNLPSIPSTERGGRYWKTKAPQPPVQSKIAPPRIYKTIPEQPIAPQRRKRQRVDNENHNYHYSTFSGYGAQIPPPPIAPPRVHRRIPEPPIAPPRRNRRRIVDTKYDNSTLPIFGAGIPPPPPPPFITPGYQPLKLPSRAQHKVAAPKQGDPLFEELERRLTARRANVYSSDEDEEE